MRIQTFVISIILTVVKCQEKIIPELITNEVSDEAITKAVNEVIASFYLDRTSVLNIITEHIHNRNNHFHFKDVLSKTLEKIDDKVSIILEESKLSRRSDRLRVYNIIFIDSYYSFDKVVRKMKPREFRFQGFYLFVLINRERIENDLKRMFDDLWAKYIVNVNIIQAKRGSPLECNMFTYFPYSESHCEKVYPVLLNTYRIGDGFVNNSAHYPNKIKNLHQCRLSVVTFDVSPFLILRKDSKNNTVGISGFDGILIKSIAMQMNFTIETIILNRTSWGRIFTNGTTTGATQMIINREANLTLGYFTSSVLRNNIMQPTNVYYTSSLVWMIVPGSPLTPLQRFHKPFHTVVWICIAINTFISVAIIVILKYQRREVRNFLFGRNVRNPLLNMTNVFFGGSMTVLPGRNFARFLLASFMLYTLVLRNAYTGALFRFLQFDVRNERVKNMKEMVEQNYTFFVLDAVKEYVEFLPQVSSKTVIMWYGQFDRNRTELQNYGNKIAMLASEDHVAYWNKANATTHFIDICAEKLSAFNLVFYLHQTSCLVPELNYNIMNFNSNGILKYLQQHFIDKSFLKPIMENKEPKKMTVGNLRGVFYAYLFGVGLAFVAFLIEHIVHAMKIYRETRSTRVVALV